MTTGSRPAPFRISITFRRKNGSILLDRLRTPDRLRLVKRLGTINPATRDGVPDALQAMFAR